MLSKKHLLFARAGMVLLTDGLVALPDPALMDAVLTQLRYAAVACSFIVSGDDLSESQSFGHVPHTELLQFLARATFGACLSHTPVS